MKLTCPYKYNWKPYSGIMGYYHMYFDQQLDIGKFSVCRILCEYEMCSTMTRKEWNKGVKPKYQLRFPHSIHNK